MRCRTCAVVLAAILTGVAARQGVDDPGIRAAVERFFAVQAAEDVPGYMALWSRTVPEQRMRQMPGQLKFIFDSGDDKFSNIAIVRVVVNGEELRVRATATRDRTTNRTQPDGTPVVVHSMLQTSLTFVREDGALKLVREGSAADDLAAAYIAAPTSDARAALLEAEPELLNEYLVSAVSRPADMASQSNQYARAQEIYLLALDVARRVGSRRMQADVLQNVANARYFSKDYAGAEQAYEERLAIARELGNDEAIASSLVGIGTVKYLTYDYNSALASLEEALAIQVRLADDGAMASTLYSTGNVRYVQADYEAAGADYRRSRDLQRKQNNSEGEARALEGVGRVSTALGDYAAAIEAYTSVLQEARRRDNRASQGNALQSLGEVQFRLGNFDTARSLFDESRGHFEALGDASNVGRVWQAIALTDLISHRFAPAEQEYGKSRAACEAGTPDRDCVARAIVGLAFAQAAQEHFADAIPTYRKAIDAFTALKKTEEAARAEVGLAQAHYGNKDMAAALGAAGHADQQALTLGASDVVWRARVVAARAHRRLGASDKAMAAARAAVATVRQMMAAALEHPSDRIASDTTAAFAILAVLQAEAGDAAAAFATVEERRVQALRGELIANEREIVRGMTPEEREDERKAAAAVVALDKQIEAERALPKPNAARIDRLKESAARASSNRAGQQQRLFERLPDLRAWRGLMAPATADDAARLFASGADVVVEFVIDDDDVLAVVAAPDDERRAEFHAYTTAVPRATLAERIAKSLEPAALRDVDLWRKAAVDMLAVMPSESFERLAAAARALVVPDDVLWRVPFEALPVKAGILADHTTVVYAASVTALVKAPAVAAGRTPAGVLAVGPPDLPPAVRDRVKSTSPGWVLRSEESASAELRASAPPAEDSTVVSLAGPGATERAFRAQAPGSATIHVAAPFRINSASPLFSPILLTPPAAGGTADLADDGALEAREIVNLDLHARVAILSDGETATMRDAAAAIPTVHWMWRAAGVPFVVLPKWNGDDSAGAALLAEVEKRLRSGVEAGAALEQARAAVRARQETSAPYFWAGWMIIGG